MHAIIGVVGSFSPDPFSPDPFSLFAYQSLKNASAGGTRPSVLSTRELLTTTSPNATSTVTTCLCNAAAPAVGAFLLLEQWCPKFSVSGFLRRRACSTGKVCLFLLFHEFVLVLKSSTLPALFCTQSLGLNNHLLGFVMEIADFIFPALVCSDPFYGKDESPISKDLAPVSSGTHGCIDCVIGECHKCLCNAALKWGNKGVAYVVDPNNKARNQYLVCEGTRITCHPCPKGRFNPIFKPRAT